MTSTSAAAATGVSSQAFLTSLVLNSVVAAVEVLAFILLRKHFKKIYAPRTYLVGPKKRADPIGVGLFAWLPAILKADPTQIIAKNGLDAYLFVRYLKLMIEIFLPFTLATFIILLPVDSVKSGGTLGGVDKYTFGNVSPGASTRYAAHLILVWLLTFYVFYLLRREYSRFIVLRQDFLISKDHSKHAQSKTVLVTGVAQEYLNVESLTRFCQYVPGGVKQIWLARSLGDLPDIYDRRLAASNKLESAETAYLKSATQAINKAGKKAAKSKKGEVTTHPAPTPEEMEADSSLISRYVEKKDRPTHKLGFLGLIGKKVDSLNWCREEIAVTDKELLEAQAVLRGGNADVQYPKESAAFIQFNKQIGAHMFAQVLAHHAPLRMSGRYLEVAQEDVIWANLNINPYQKKIRMALGALMTLGLIILWAFPVAFVGLLTNITALCTKASWLAWLCKLPSPVNGIIQGALPPIGLAVLFIFLPIFLRMFARFEGIPLNSLVEVSLMSRFFLFLVIHGFLIVTLAAGLVAAIPQIAANPSSAVQLLATKLPAASTFFLTYFVTVGLGGSAGALLQIVTLVIYYVKLFLLGSTPRAVFDIRYTMSTVQYGTAFPSMTLLTVIGLTYSVIAPLVSSLALLAFGLFYFVYKYLFIWVYDSPPEAETAGRFYPLALGHIFVGLYIEEICLAGLFFLAQDQNGKQSALAEGILMVILIIITIFYQRVLLSGYGPLVDYLPLSFAERIDEIQATPESPVHGRDESAVMANKGSGSSEELKTEHSFPPQSNDDRERLVQKDTFGYEKTQGLGLDGGRNMERSLTAPGEHVDVHAFDHPATYVTQRTVWIPVDTHGFYKSEVAESRAAGVDISTEGAVMDAKGNVSVVRSPPGDDWDVTQTL